MGNSNLESCNQVSGGFFNKRNLWKTMHWKTKLKVLPTKSIDGQKSRNSWTEQKAVGICSTTFTRETLLNKIASTKNYRTVSTQRRTRVCWLVLEPSISAVGLSTLRNMLENHPLNCVILPIFLPVIQTWFWHGKPAASAWALATGGKRRAIAFHFSVRICYMLLSKCRGKSNDV